MTKREKGGKKKRKKIIVSRRTVPDLIQEDKIAVLVGDPLIQPHPGSIPSPAAVREFGLQHLAPFDQPNIPRRRGKVPIPRPHKLAILVRQYVIERNRRWTHLARDRATVGDELMTPLQADVAR